MLLKRYYKNIYVFCLLPFMLCLAACGQIDTQRKGEDFKKEMNAKKLKRLTDGQIQTAAYEQGKNIATRLEGHAF